MPFGSESARLTQVFRSVAVRVDSDWVDKAYLSLAVCYHHEATTALETKSHEQKLKAIHRVVLSHSHWSIAEAIGVHILVEGAPHDSLMQLRTHRHLSCQVTSQRYTGSQFAASGFSVADSFYFRAMGDVDYKSVVKSMTSSLLAYVDLISNAVPEEAARCILPQGIRQSMAISCNLRSLLHVIGVRSLSDSQAEVRAIVLEVFDKLVQADGDLAELVLAWGKANLGKYRLSP